MGCTCTQYDQVTSTAKYCCREVDEYRVMGCTCTQYDQVISTAKYCCREVDEYRVMGCPKCIDDKKYERNAFIFNFVFVFSSSMDTSSYVPVIQKMGNAFRTYEVCSDCMYVCIGDYRDPKTRELRVLVCMSKSLTFDRRECNLLFRDFKQSLDFSALPVQPWQNSDFQMAG